MFREAGARWHSLCNFITSFKLFFLDHFCPVVDTFLAGLRPKVSTIGLALKERCVVASGPF